MRLLHTADLHLGKMLNDRSMLEEQERILRQIVELAVQRKVDAVLISGDIYHKSTPPAEAAKVFDAFICTLAEKKIKAFLISGNHDSEARVSYFSSLVRSSGIFISEAFDGTLQKHTLKDEFGPVNFYLLPFFKPSAVKSHLPEEKITCSQEAMKAILKQSPINVKERNILLCHQFITGAEMSDSEERLVGGVDGIEAALLSRFDYVALGHIHKPQAMTGKTIRYSGSPLKYSFSEVNHKKSVTLIDLREKGDVQVECIGLQPVRDLEVKEGFLDELMRQGYCENYVQIILHDEIVPPDAQVTLTTMYPNLLKFTVDNSKTKVDYDVIAKETLEKKTVQELFCDFYRLQNEDILPGEAHMKVLEKALKRMEGEKR